MGVDKNIVEKRKKLGPTQQTLTNKLGVTDKSIVNVSKDTFYNEITV